VDHVAPDEPIPDVETPSIPLRDAFIPVIEKPVSPAPEREIVYRSTDGSKTTVYVPFPTVVRMSASSIAKLRYPPTSTNW
jgi:hypothetical protein